MIITLMAYSINIAFNVVLKVKLYANLIIFILGFFSFMSGKIC